MYDTLQRGFLRCVVYTVVMVGVGKTGKIWDLQKCYDDTAHKVGVMTVSKAPRAAHARSLVSGRAWDRGAWQRVEIQIRPGLLDLAEQYSICMLKAHRRENTIQGFSEWVQDRLIEVIREKEKEQKERIRSDF